MIGRLIVSVIAIRLSLCMLLLVGWSVGYEVQMLCFGYDWSVVVYDASFGYCGSAIVGRLTFFCYYASGSIGEHRTCVGSDDSHGAAVVYHGAERVYHVAQLKKS